jgi:hypothetical protein
VSAPSAEARRLYADQFRAKGPTLRNLADSIETGAHDAAFWAAPALAAIDFALRHGAPDIEAL